MEVWVQPDEVGAMDGDKRGLDSQSQVTSGPLRRTAVGAQKKRSSRCLANKTGNWHTGLTSRRFRSIQTIIDRSRAASRDKSFLFLTPGSRST